MKCARPGRSLPLSVVVNMLSTELTVFLLSLLALFGLGLGVGAAFYARKAATYCRDVTIWAESGWEVALRDGKTGKLEARIAEIDDTLSSHEASLKRLRSKYAMRDMRDKRKEENGGTASPVQADFVSQDNSGSSDEKKRLRLYAKERGLMR